MAQPGDATRLLEQMQAGAPGAADALVPVLQAELRTIAAKLLRAERAGHTLQPTASRPPGKRWGGRQPETGHKADPDRV